MNSSPSFLISVRTLTKVSSVTVGDREHFKSVPDNVPEFVFMSCISQKGKKKGEKQEPGRRKDRIETGWRFHIATSVYD